MSGANEGLLRELHGALAKELLERVASGEASSSDLAAAAKFLKDNEITAVIEDNSDMDALRQKLANRRARAPVAPTARELDDLADSLGGLH